MLCIKSLCWHAERRGGGEEERTAKEKVDGGDTGGYGHGPGGAKRSVEEPESVEDADYGSHYRTHQVDSTK